MARWVKPKRHDQGVLTRKLLEIAQKYLELQRLRIELEKAEMELNKHPGTVPRRDTQKR